MIGVAVGKALSVLLIPFGWVIGWAVDAEMDWDDDDRLD